MCGYTSPNGTRALLVCVCDFAMCAHVHAFCTFLHFRGGSKPCVQWPVTIANLFAFKRRVAIHP